MSTMNPPPSSRELANAQAIIDACGVTHIDECTDCDGLGAFTQDYSRSCHSSDPGSRTCSKCNGTGRAQAMTEKKSVTLDEARTMLNKRQFWALERIHGFYQREMGSTPEAYNLHFELTPTDYGVVWVSIHLDRIDCHPSSIRAVLCNDGGHFAIGKRGAIRVGNSYRVIGDAQRRKKHHAFLATMLRGTVLN